MFNPHFKPSGVLGDFCDAQIFQKHQLFSKDPQSLQLILYYDDIEVCNPLGSAKKIHKLG